MCGASPSTRLSRRCGAVGQRLLIFRRIVGDVSSSAAKPLLVTRSMTGDVARTVVREALVGGFADEVIQPERRYSPVALSNLRRPSARTKKSRPGSPDDHTFPSGSSAGSRWRPELTQPGNNPGTTGREKSASPASRRNMRRESRRHRSQQMSHRILSSDPTSAATHSATPRHAHAVVHDKPATTASLPQSANEQPSRRYR
jgi:hypothetical protein